MATYFAFDSEDGFTLHKTKKAARRDAHKRLKSWKEEAIKDGEWLSDAGTTCWGKVEQLSIGIVDYEMKDV